MGTILISFLGGNLDQAKHQLNLPYLLGERFQADGIAADIHLVWFGGDAPNKIDRRPANASHLLILTLMRQNGFTWQVL
jgi:hypothetical protein